MRDLHAALPHLLAGQEDGEAGAPGPDGGVRGAHDAGPRPPRVLVVEDEWFIAADMADALSDAGMAVLGPVGTVPDALGLIASAAADGGITAAVLDVNLGGELVTPVVAALTAIRVPFLYATGYNAWRTPGEDGAVPFLQKPFAPDAVVHAVRNLTGARCDGAAPRHFPDGPYRPSARIVRSITAASS